MKYTAYKEKLTGKVLVYQEPVDFEVKRRVFNDEISFLETEEFTSKEQAIIYFDKTY